MTAPIVLNTVFILTVLILIAWIANTIHRSVSAIRALYRLDKGRAIRVAHDQLKRDTIRSLLERHSIAQSLKTVDVAVTLTPVTFSAHSESIVVPYDEEDSKVAVELDMLGPKGEQYGVMSSMASASNSMTSPPGLVPPTSTLEASASAVEMTAHRRPFAYARIVNFVSPSSLVHHLQVLFNTKKEHQDSIKGFDDSVSNSNALLAESSDAFVLENALMPMEVLHMERYRSTGGTAGVPSPKEGTLLDDPTAMPQQPRSPQRRRESAQSKNVPWRWNVTLGFTVVDEHKELMLELGRKLSSSAKHLMTMSAARDADQIFPLGVVLNVCPLTPNPAAGDATCEEPDNVFLCYTATQSRLVFPEAEQQRKQMKRHVRFASVHSSGDEGEDEFELDFPMTVMESASAEPTTTTAAAQALKSTADDFGETLSSSSMVTPPPEAEEKPTADDTTLDDSVSSVYSAVSDELDESARDRLQQKLEASKQKKLANDDEEPPATPMLSGLAKAEKKRKYMAETEDDDVVGILKCRRGSNVRDHFLRLQEERRKDRRKEVHLVMDLGLHLVCIGEAIYKVTEVPGLGVMKKPTQDDDDDDDDARSSVSRPGDVQETCVVCYTHPKCVCCLPCGHLELCGDCVMRLEQCPLCRTPIESVLSFTGM